MFCLGEKLADIAAICTTVFNPGGFIRPDSSNDVQNRRFLTSSAVAHPRRMTDSTHMRHYALHAPPSIGARSRRILTLVVTLASQGCQAKVPALATLPAIESRIALVYRSSEGLRDTATKVEYVALPTRITSRGDRFVASPPIGAPGLGSVWVFDVRGRILKTIPFPTEGDRASTAPLVIARGRGDTLWALDRDGGCIATLTPDDRWTDRVCLEGLTAWATDFVRLPNGETIVAEDKGGFETVGRSIQRYAADGKWMGALQPDANEEVDLRSLAGRRIRLATAPGSDVWVYHRFRPLITRLGPTGKTVSEHQLELPGFVPGPELDALPSRARPPWSYVQNIVDLGGDSIAVLYLVPNPGWQREAGWRVIKNDVGLATDTPTHADKLNQSRIAIVDSRTGGVVRTYDIPATIVQLDSRGRMIAVRQEGDQNWRIDHWRWSR